MKGVTCLKRGAEAVSTGPGSRSEGAEARLLTLVFRTVSAQLTDAVVPPRWSVCQTSNNAIRARPASLGTTDRPGSTLPVIHLDLL